MSIGKGRTAIGCAQSLSRNDDGLLTLSIMMWSSWINHDATSNSKVQSPIDISVFYYSAHGMISAEPEMSTIMTVS